MQNCQNLAEACLILLFKKGVMKKVFLAIIFLHVSLLAETFGIDQFRANVFAKADKKPVEVQVSLVFEGKDIGINEHKVIDALNIVIGSYYAEDLVTSRGKELLKSTLIAYAKKMHNLTIDTIYIKDLIVKTNPSVKEIVDALKKEGVFQQNNSAPKQQSQQQQSPTNFLAPPLPRKLPLPNEDAVNF